MDRVATETSVRQLADRLIAALNVRDIDAVKACVAEDAEFRSVLAGLDGEIYVGHAGIDRYFGDLMDTFESTVWRLLDVEEGTEDRFVLTLEISAKGRVSGAVLTYVLPNVWAIRDGLIALQRRLSGSRRGAARGGYRSLRQRAKAASGGSLR